MQVDTFDKTIAQPRKRMYKTRSKRRSVWSKTVWPLCQFVIFLALVVLFIQIAASRISKPIGVYSRENGQMQMLSKELNNIEKENSDLNNKIKYLKTPEGAAEAARKLGWVKKGEIILVLPNQPGKKNN